MTVAIAIDFENVYKFDSVSEDWKKSTFRPEVMKGEKVPLIVEIGSEAHELLPNVYNLAFGPRGPKGRIDDKALLTYKDYSKVFSTILFTGLTYLNINNGHFIGIDGSNNARAFLYYRIIQKNFDYLDHYFNIYGLKYYVRITRFGKRQYDNPFDFEDVLPSPARIQKGGRTSVDLMYNYFIFNRK
ncbi:DUF6934 family protein [Dinghuibacter silviterrae]|uniref:Uncharacterized protein n=1 Tax=Dinghuibacter silviterrae TaxID=1539049 RepID=A0A4R8DRF9_9BACT|nr:hypothetical protein EDB95_1021 [Dinghuibacter silviterrae]